MTYTHYHKLIKKGVTFRPRAKFDFYPTSREYVISQYELVKSHPSTIIDPGAGGGIYGEIGRERYPDAHITGVEIQKDLTPSDNYDEVVNQDFLRYSPQAPVDLVIGNPPYKIAEKMVRAALGMIKPGGELIFLLPINFAASKRRYKLYKEYPLFRLVVCSDRPSFTGDGKTDSRDYGFFHWVKGFDGATILEHKISRN